MRFCIECGNTLPAQAAPAPAPAPVVAPAPAFVPPTVPPMSQQAPLAAQVESALGGPVCGRCRGVGDPGTEFCKFCGARYSEFAAGSVGQAAGFASTAPAGGPQATIAQVASPPAGAATARIVSVQKDGSDGQAYPLIGERADLGRVEGDIVLADDPYLSPRHARLERKPNGWVLRDLDSLNGVYIRLREPVELRDGDSVLLGQQVLRFEELSEHELPLGPASTHGVMVFGTPEVARVARLVQYTTEGLGRDVHCLYRGETVLGRENGDIVFTDDPFLSRRHASIRIDGTNGLDSAKGMGGSRRRFVLRDLGSSNGTAMRLRGDHVLADADLFRVGRHLFRFEALASDANPSLEGFPTGRGSA